MPLTPDLPLPNDPFVFGIYPGGEAGTDDGIAGGPPADPARIHLALTTLAGAAAPFIVRVYERFSDVNAPSRWPRQTPQNYTQYLRPGRLLDLVVMFQSKSGDVPGFLDFVRSLIAQHGPSLYSVQVTEEANFTDGPDCIDGPWPRVREALVEGVVAAKQEAVRLGLTNLRVGFNSTPTFGPSAEFWSGIGALGGQSFLGALDYVGIDFFPDTFRPTPDIRASVLGVLESMRNEWLPAAGISASVPIHIAENGWPTSPERPFEKQSAVLETTIRTVLEHRELLNIRRYTLFALRDAESFAPESAENIFFHFGLMQSDYTAKPAFETCRLLIAEFQSEARPAVA
jgi:hypothetical protein